ncbi:TIGR03013 family XrtA/PEP-CTERM system glycosyltransferase [Aromatoleum petrolei]|uniref:TIGR03013 family PEP-CTERM/XrtA system glycosyltransferase n=1 Tax=Aromatoleum petrolei TaxID=76116 RepID=A0ABX1MS40_9RHOO|nr:TIGR03013 family XrtA/PEP-CTERM system glycosyltransferase [Aromatoleum petrolei]NMF90755.1 TIGR03013 family PEP-CTERM/XrtA system glycosyltransferase [Aromatoleum petrolei]QTQ35380.1 Sugar transferase, PEP-CTERM system associated [Aromatoleum petrolei]
MFKVFKQYVPSHALQQIAFDASILFVVVLVVTALPARGSQVEWRLVVPSALLFALLMILLNGALGLYRARALDGGGRSTASRIVVSVVVSVVVAFAVFAILPWGYFQSEAVQVSIVLLLGGLLVMRGLANRRGSASAFDPRVLIIGTGTEADAVARSLDAQGVGRDLVGFYRPVGEETPVVNPERILPEDGNLLDTVRRLHVSEVIVAVRERRGGVLPIRELLDCKLRGVKVLDLSSFFERTHGQVPIGSLKASWLIYGEGFHQGVVRRTIKRCFDVLASAILLMFALPVMLVTACLILLEDGGPVLYRQERVGRRGRIFRVIKFRSMRQDAEGDGRPRWAQSGDDRVTRVGHVIRRFRIDELPQLLNVLSGEMSLVGPRPERPYFVDQLTREIPFYSVRHSVKPGVTGWAQVRYQYGASVDDAIQKLQYDLYYVKNHNLALDILVLFETVRVVLTCEGAH